MTHGPRLSAILLSWMCVAACAATQSAFQPSREAFFDPRMIEELGLGRATPDDVRGLLGEPYLDSRASPDVVMWVYDFSSTRQAVVYFRGGLLVEKGWTNRYPNPIEPEMIFPARPELRKLLNE